MIGPQSGYSERRVCNALCVNRSTVRYKKIQGEKDVPYLEKMREIANRPRLRKYGYKRVTDVITKEYKKVNYKRGYRLWCLLEYNRLARKGKRKGRDKGCSDNACHINRAGYLDHIWTIDFMEDKFVNGRKFRIFNVLDEFSRECLASEVEKRFKAYDVKEVLRYLFLVRGVPYAIRCDNGREFLSNSVSELLLEFGVELLNVKAGSPWENGYIESYHARFRDECLDGEIILSLTEAKYVANRWRMDYNHHRDHSGICKMTPSEFARMCREMDWTWHRCKLIKTIEPQEVLKE